MPRRTIHRSCPCPSQECQGCDRLPRFSLPVVGLINIPTTQIFDIIHFLHEAVQKWPTIDRRIFINKVKSNQKPIGNHP